ncbi:hypothetical protein ACFGVR_21925 [Mucilaginibacter sp. AW1-3]
MNLLFLFIVGLNELQANKTEIMLDATNVYYLSYDEFNSKKETLRANAKNITNLYIYTSSNLYDPGYADDSELPMNGFFLDDLAFFKDFENLKQLFLNGLFIKDLPEYFASFKKMEDMQICFSRSTNVENALKILLKMPALKYIDLNTSKLSMEKRDYLIKHLTKKGIKVYDYFSLHEPTN